MEPSEDVTDGLDVKVSLMPEFLTEEIPQWFLNRWGEVIISKAMVDLCSMPKQPWSNPNMVAKHMERGNRLENKVRIENRREFRKDYQSFTA